MQALRSVKVCTVKHAVIEKYQAIDIKVGREGFCKDH